MVRNLGVGKLQLVGIMKYVWPIKRIYMDILFKNFEFSYYENETNIAQLEAIKERFICY